jgi:hypothetical protein
MRVLWPIDSADHAVLRARARLEYTTGMFALSVTAARFPEPEAGAIHPRMSAVADARGGGQDYGPTRGTALPLPPAERGRTPASLARSTGLTADGHSDAAALTSASWFALRISIVRECLSNREPSLLAHPSNHHPRAKSRVPIALATAVSFNYTGSRSTDRQNDSRK